MYTINPSSYKHYLYKDLKQLTDHQLRTANTKQLQTHIGKVKSHTDIEYNETVVSTAMAVVDREVPPDITFDEADPPSRGPPHITTNKTHNTKQAEQHP